MSTSSAKGLFDRLRRGRRGGGALTPAVDVPSTDAPAAAVAPPDPTPDPAPPASPMSPLDQAAALVGDGRIVDAIGLLTEANGRQRDLAVEERLLDLRFEAFQQRRGQWGAPPAWPDRVPDLWPGETVPEIDRADLNVETMRSGIQTHGSILVRGMLDESLMAILRDGIDRSIAGYDAREAGETPLELDGWYAPTSHCPGEYREFKRRAGAVLAVDSPPGLFDLVDVLERTGVKRLAEEYFDEPPMLLARKTTLRRVPHVSWGSGDWHQDGAFMGTDIRSLNVWFALTHCGDDAPGLDIVGRRLDHLAETGTDTANATWSVGAAVAEKEGEGCIVRPIFEAGDALLFDHMMLHRTAAEAEMVNDRYAVETWFLAPSTYETMLASEADLTAPTDQRPFWL
jgi:Phytanoyl-CoA dioxygenase (PhyH)